MKDFLRPVVLASMLMILLLGFTSASSFISVGSYGNDTMCTPAQLVGLLNDSVVMVHVDESNGTAYIKARNVSASICVIDGEIFENVTIPVLTVSYEASENDTRIVIEQFVWGFIECSAESNVGVNATVDISRNSDVIIYLEKGILRMPNGMKLEGHYNVAPGRVDFEGEFSYVSIAEATIKD